MFSVSPRSTAWDDLSSAEQIGIIVASSLSFCMAVILITFVIMHRLGQNILSRKTSMAITQSHRPDLEHPITIPVSSMNHIRPMVFASTNAHPTSFINHRPDLSTRAAKVSIGVPGMSPQKPLEASTQIQEMVPWTCNATLCDYDERGRRTCVVQPDDAAAYSCAERVPTEGMKPSSGLSSNLDSTLLSSTGATVHSDDYV